MNRPSDAAIALKPCPFCGGDPVLRYVGNDRSSSRKVTVKCRGCRMQLTHAARIHDFAWLEHHIEADWNRRAIDAEAKAAAGETGALIRAGDALSFAAQISGGVAGRDDGLVAAIEGWIQARAAIASAPTAVEGSNG